MLTCESFFISVLMSSLIADPLLSNLEPLPDAIPKGSKAFEVTWEVLVFFERNE